MTVGAAYKIRKTLYLDMEQQNSMEASFINIHQSLIDECKLGDQKAQFKIYKLYYKAMYNTSLRIVGDITDAEDIMQESFLSAFEKIETYSETVAFGAWLKKIVVNRSLDYVNKKKMIFEDIESHYDIAENVHYEHVVEDETSSKVEQVKEAIKKLPEGYRIILSLYLLEGYDHEEIAEIMKISCNTSRSQLSRAKQKLIGILRKNEN
jgi:RNA polymerase sigma-70 factor (ECF subfamily)